MTRHPEQSKTAASLNNGDAAGDLAANSNYEAPKLTNYGKLVDLTSFGFGNSTEDYYIGGGPS